MSTATKLTQAQFDQIKAKNQGLKKILKAKTISVATKDKSLVSITLKDSVSDAVKLLALHQISSLPVYDAEYAHAYVAFVDIMDILTKAYHIISDAQLQKGEEVGFEKFAEKDAELANLRVVDVTNKSLRDYYLEVTQDRSLADAIKLFVEFAIETHRLAICDKQQRDLKGILSQSQVIRFLNKHVDDFPHLASMKISELRLGYGQVVSVFEKDTLEKAIQVMNLKKLTALAIIDKNKKLVGNISASDIKKIEFGGGLLGYVLLSVKEFLTQTSVQVPPRMRKPEIVKPDTTIKELLALFTKTKVHRLYVLGEKDNLLGVISLIDVLGLVCKIISDE